MHGWHLWFLWCCQEPQMNVVALRSHDFTGLGFNICGNMRDGIFVKDVLHRGPASESGRIAPGMFYDALFKNDQVCF